MTNTKAVTSIPDNMRNQRRSVGGLFDTVNERKSILYTSRKEVIAIGMSNIHFATKLESSVCIGGKSLPKNPLELAMTMITIHKTIDNQPA